MAKKFYAVRRGNQTGILNSWDECKMAVAGYPNAEYKGFNDRDAAEAYLNGKEFGALKASEPIKNFTPSNITDTVIFVDAYISKDYMSSYVDYGICYEMIDGEHTLCGRIVVADDTSEYDARIMAVYAAVKSVVGSGRFSNITVVIGYAGAYELATGSWAAKNEMQSRFVGYMHALLQSSSIRFKMESVTNRSAYNGFKTAKAEAKKAKNSMSIISLQQLYF